MPGTRGVKLCSARATGNERAGSGCRRCLASAGRVAGGSQEAGCSKRRFFCHDHVSMPVTHPTHYSSHRPWPYTGGLFGCDDPLQPFRPLPPFGLPSAHPGQLRVECRILDGVWPVRLAARWQRGQAAQGGGQNAGEPLATSCPVTTECPLHCRTAPCPLHQQPKRPVQGPPPPLPATPLAPRQPPLPT